MTEVRERVRQRYAEAALAVVNNRSGGCCDDSCCSPAADVAEGPRFYSADEQSELPQEAVLASLGCGNPLAVADLHEGERVLDLARANAEKAGATNVEFVRGNIEAIPLPAAAVDVVVSNCVINLSDDKPAVFREMFRVLAPGGRVGVSDVDAEDDLTPADRAERGSYVGCIAGALSRSEYLDGLADAGFAEASVEFTYEAAPGMHGAIVRASKPA